MDSPKLDKTCPLMKCKCIGTLCAWWFDGYKDCSMVITAGAALQLENNITGVLYREGKIPS